MKTFLQLVAQDLYAKIGNDLSRTAIVFPNKRASLFFNEYLAAQSDHPLWSPAYVNISELFRSLSPLKPGDPIRLVCELYKVFREETHSEEPLDDFYFWGELLISDFDDVDKNLVDADKLFSNLQDLKNIMDDYDFLDQEQEEAIQQFFQNFSIDKRTQLKEKFISLWDKLGDIYRHYRKNLSGTGHRLRRHDVPQCNRGTRYGPAALRPLRICRLQRAEQSRDPLLPTLAGCGQSHVLLGL